MPRMKSDVERSSARCCSTILSLQRPDQWSTEKLFVCSKCGDSVLPFSKKVTLIQLQRSRPSSAAGRQGPDTRPCGFQEICMPTAQWLLSFCRQRQIYSPPVRQSAAFFIVIRKNLFDFIRRVAFRDRAQILAAIPGFFRKHFSSIRGAAPPVASTRGFTRP
jgi:hypothetical protein